MALKNFYTIETTEKTDEMQWKSVVRLNPSHELYSGHFPEFPVVPGACSVKMAKEIAAQILARKLQIAEISSCKFLKMLRPDECGLLTFNLSFAQDGDVAFRLTADGECGNEIFLKLKLKVNVVD